MSSFIFNSKPPMSRSPLRLFGFIFQAVASSLSLSWSRYHRVPMPVTSAFSLSIRSFRLSEDGSEFYIHQLNRSRDTRLRYRIGVSAIRVIDFSPIKKVLESRRDIGVYRGEEDGVEPLSSSWDGNSSGPRGASYLARPLRLAPGYRFITSLVVGSSLRTGCKCT